MSDNRECQMCGDYYTLRQECEPTAYCDLCAQTMLADVIKERDELKSQVGRLREALRNLFTASLYVLQHKYGTNDPVGTRLVALVDLKTFTGHAGEVLAETKEAR